jgi:predicted nucleic acid-binding protein
VSGLLVVDASAVVATLVERSPRGEAAATRMAGAALAAPDLIGYEVLNVLRRRRAAGQLSAGEALRAVNLWSALAVDLWRLEALSGRVWELAGAMSSYDAAYVALAERLGAPLLTADRRLANAPGIGADVIVV